jgi:hypothetical protein
MICVNAFLLALLVFGVVLVRPTAPPSWLWALNGGGLAYGMCAFCYWCREAHRRDGS